jgi:hypothetical protein
MFEPFQTRRQRHGSTKKIGWCLNRRCFDIKVIATSKFYRGVAMARSKCPSCEYHEFEAVPVTTKTGQKFCLIQCVACGTVVGALDEVKITNVIKSAERKLSKFLENLNSKVITACNRKKT